MYFTIVHSTRLHLKQPVPLAELLNRLKSYTRDFDVVSVNWIPGDSIYEILCSHPHGIDVDIIEEYRYENGLCETDTEDEDDELGLI